ncbi:hypothetical protein Tco_1009731 [Tanacetum coccineum]
MDFLTRSSIYYALTVSPIVSTSFVEQFWTTAKSRTVNNISYIDATVAGKPVTISEASIRSDLLFDDADGIDSLNNQAIFDNIQLMGNQLKDVPVPLDHFPVPTLTKKVLTFMVKKGKNFSGKVTPLFDSILVQQIEDEAIPDFNPEGSGGIMEVTDQAKEIKLLKAQIKKESQTCYHTSQILDEKCCTEDEIGKEYFSKENRDSNFEDLDDFVDVDDTLDYMETEDDQDEGRTRYVVLEEKESADKEQDGGTDSTKVHTDRQGEGTADQNEGKSATQTAPTTTSTPTPTIFGDDETIAHVLIIMSQNKQKKKEKGVEIRNVEDTKRPRPTSTRFVLTLKPLPKIDPKDKGKKIIDEEGEFDTESDDITKAEKKFKMLAKDEEVARKVQEEWEAREEKKRLAEEEATKVALTNEYDCIQARINTDKILAKELQKEEREKFTIKQRAIFLHDTITAQRKFLAQQRLKRKDQNFVAIGSAKDERQIKELNKDPKKKRVIKETPREEDTAKVPAEQEVTEQGTKKRKSGDVNMLARKRPRPQPDDGSDDEHIKCLRIVTFDSTIDSEIMETKSFVSKLHKISSPDGDYLVVYRVNGHFRAFNYLMENNQQDWEIVSGRLYEACGVCILELKDRTIIYMLVERRYPLSKELLQRMLDLGLEVEEESITALHLTSRIDQSRSKRLLLRVG